MKIFNITIDIEMVFQKIRVKQFLFQGLQERLEKIETSNFYA